jgi:hypothetical protein
MVMTLYTSWIWKEKINGTLAKIFKILYTISIYLGWDAYIIHILWIKYCNFHNLLMYVGNDWSQT